MAAICRPLRATPNPLSPHSIAFPTLHSTLIRRGRCHADVSVALMHGFTVLGNREEFGGVPIQAWMARWCINYARRSAASLFDQQADPHGHMFAERPECAHGVGHGSFVKAGDSSHGTYPAKELQGLPDHYLQLWELVPERHRSPETQRKWLQANRDLSTRASALGRAASHHWRRAPDKQHTAHSPTGFPPPSHCPRAEHHLSRHLIRALGHACWHGMHGYSLVTAPLPQL